MDNNGVCVRLVCAKCWATLAEDEDGNGFKCLECGREVSWEAMIGALKETLALAQEMAPKALTQKIAPPAPTREAMSAVPAQEAVSDTLTLEAAQVRRGAKGCMRGLQSQQPA